MAITHFPLNYGAALDCDTRATRLAGQKMGRLQHHPLRGWFISSLFRASIPQTITSLQTMWECYYIHVLLDGFSDASNQLLFESGCCIKWFFCLIQQTYFSEIPFVYKEVISYKIKIFTKYLSYQCLTSKNYDRNVIFW